MPYQLTPEKIQKFKLLYGRRSNRELAMHFGVSIAHIEEMAMRLALGKDKVTFKGNKMPRWNAEQIARLVEMYPTNANLDIARALGRTVKAVVSKAHHLKLKKSDERLTQMGQQNVALRADRQVRE